MNKILSQSGLDNLIKNKENGILKCLMKLPVSRTLAPLSIKRVKSGNYFVHYEITDTNEIIFHKLLMESLPIGEAIKHKTLYTYN